MASDPPSKRRRKNQSEESTIDDSLRKRESSPVVVFAHGAGAPSTSEWMIRWKEMLGEALNAVEVVTFDYPYISGGKRKAPPKAEKLVDHHLDVVNGATTKYPGHPLVLVGKSMGSRVSCMVASAKDIHVSAIICLGYPLKVSLIHITYGEPSSDASLRLWHDGSVSPKESITHILFIHGTLSEKLDLGINGAVRDETLLQLTVPTMFVQGSKDGLCPLDKLAATRKKMKCINELHVIDGGDHSFKIGKKFLESTGSDQDEAERRAVKAIAEFVTRSTL